MHRAPHRQQLRPQDRFHNSKLHRDNRLSSRTNKWCSTSRWWRWCKRSKTRCDVSLSMGLIKFSAWIVIDCYSGLLVEAVGRDEWGGKERHYRAFASRSTERTRPPRKSMFPLACPSYGKFNSSNPAEPRQRLNDHGNLRPGPSRNDQRWRWSPHQSFHQEV